MGALVAAAGSGLLITGFIALVDRLHRRER